MIERRIQDDVLNLEVAALDELDRHPPCGEIASQPASDAAAPALESPHPRCDTAHRELLRNCFPQDQ